MSGNVCMCVECEERKSEGLLVMLAYIQTKIPKTGTEGQNYYSLVNKLMFQKNLAIHKNKEDLSLLR